MAEANSQQQDLPGSVQAIRFDGREIFLVGTAHVSQRSVDDVRQTIEKVEPDCVCVELDEARYRTLVDQDRWKNTDIIEVVRKGNAMLLLSSLIMTSFQRRIGRKLGVMPGAELLAAAQSAAESDIALELIDRDIQTTLKRTWSNLGFWRRLTMGSQLAASLLVSEAVDEETIEELKQEEKLADVLSMLAEEFPLLKHPLIDERDVYMAQKLREVDRQRIVAVVGAGHVPGIVQQIRQDHDIGPLEDVPPPSPGGTVLKWAIPALIAGLFVYGFVTGGAERSVESIYIWILINGALSALGAALAFGHPLTILAAFLAAPLTSLNPMLAAGWVSGLVQALVKKPTVHDLEQLPEAITSVKGFWTNAASRILLVVVLSNLGSVLGTFIAGSWIAVRLFGT